MRQRVVGFMTIVMFLTCCREITGSFDEIKRSSSEFVWEGEYCLEVYYKNEEKGIFQQYQLRGNITGNVLSQLNEIAKLDIQDLQHIVFDHQGKAEFRDSYGGVYHLEIIKTGKICNDKHRKAVQCRGKTKKGERCRKRTKNENGLCHLHQEQKNIR